MRRRTVIVVGALIAAGGAALPALASQPPPVPVGVYRDSNGGVCVGAFSWVPQCTDKLLPPAVGTAAR